MVEMNKLKEMLCDRKHRFEIGEYVYNNYGKLAKDVEAEFIESMLNPELKKPKRYFGFVPTKRTYIEKIILTNGKVCFYPDMVCTNKMSQSSLAINGDFIKELNVKENFIKMYRITAACVIVIGSIKMDNMVYKDQKIVYIPEETMDLNFKFIDSPNYKRTIEFETLGRVTLRVYQHIEYVPIKNHGDGKVNSCEIKLYDELRKYKKYFITNYNADQENIGEP